MNKKEASAIIDEFPQELSDVPAENRRVEIKDGTLVHVVDWDGCGWWQEYAPTKFWGFLFAVFENSTDEEVLAVYENAR